MSPRQVLDTHRYLTHALLSAPEWQQEDIQQGIDIVTERLREMGATVAPLRSGYPASVVM
jgi:hypothetical protein